ncbi:hypothetical protein [Halobiforma nitratireducens]|uniref:HIRAN domain-containing protein n=1 Tax=Halobiforma nitratireducens JCM 10879 TaxID=1227454 RepID=M0LZ72_9EURY|nr:hypothetical protein [Halobiforma nitratireducens]EMA38746.1 hypothetical protein C446_09498 [Halobiforma nitratireducens JCM 10879]
MRVVYKPGNSYEEIDCFDFREYEHGVVLHDEQGHNVGYVPHEILSHIEPHPGEEVDFEDGQPPEPAHDEE